VLANRRILECQLALVFFFKKMGYVNDDNGTR
jgi:hypothetical protein